MVSAAVHNNNTSKIDGERDTFFTATCIHCFMGIGKEGERGREKERESRVKRFCQPGKFLLP